ncbi:hypothetical protein KKF91_05955 [Myxococcota bacterium]|nr:hypothetical protein [Myxococcota bacterium]MBU1430095.1 hypothetical protein [Myxococcota bacterium]MBU1899536.1 hypothetical protein [Myxococcota bacterium]
MGLLSALFEKRAVFTDYVYMDALAKQRGWTAWTRRALEEGRRPLLLYHFPRSLEPLRRALDEVDVAVEILTDLSALGDGDVGRRAARVLSSGLIPERRLGSHAGRRAPPALVQTPVDVLLIERYPIPARDQRVLALRGWLGAGARFIAFSAFDDPLFERVGAERLQAMIRGLGLEPDEPLTHRMISRAIEGAQAKVARRARSDHGAEDAAGWWARNAPR